MQPSEVMTDLVTGTEIDYRPKTYEHGSYRFNRLLPVQGPLNVPLNATNVTVTTLEIPAKVFNLAKSVLRFTQQCPAPNASTTDGVWFHADTLSCIDRLSLFTRSGVYLADLTNFNTYMKVTNKWTNSVDDLKNCEIGQASDWAALDTGNATWTNGFQICNSEPLNLPQKLGKKKALQNATNALPAGSGTVAINGAFGAVAGANAAEIVTSVNQVLNSGANRFAQVNNYMETGNQMPQALDSTGTIRRTEQRYLFSVGRADTQAPGNHDRRTFINYLIKFGQIPHSIFALNKDLYFGETLILQINWAPVNRIGFKGVAYFRQAEDVTAADTNDITAELHPASTYLGYTPPAGAPVGGNAANAVLPAVNSNAPAGKQNFQMNNVTLYLAVETNRALIETIVRQMSTSGLRMLVPYVVANKYTSTAGTTQNVQQRINRAWGRTLLRVYHSVFNATETEIYAYDNYNVSGSKVTNVYTTLDNDRIQEVNLDCTTQDEWLFMSDLLKGTAYQSPEHFQSSWALVDDWTGRSPVEHKKMDIGECGLTLAQERLWQIYMQTAAASYNHYSFFVTQKMLTITPTQITII